MNFYRVKPLRFGGIDQNYTGNTSLRMVQMKRPEWRKSFQRCGQGKGRNTGVRKLFPFLELKRQRAEMESSEP